MKNRDQRPREESYAAQLDFSGGETKELALALFLMLYLTTLRRELQARSRSTSS